MSCFNPSLSLISFANWILFEFARTELLSSRKYNRYNVTRRKRLSCLATFFPTFANKLNLFLIGEDVIFIGLFFSVIFVLIGHYLMSWMVAKPWFRSLRGFSASLGEHLLSKCKLNYLWKMRGYPLFSFWILIALAKGCFFNIVKNTFVLVGKFFEKPEYLGPYPKCAEHGTFFLILILKLSYLFCYSSQETIVS